MISHRGRFNYSVAEHVQEIAILLLLDLTALASK